MANAQPGSAETVEAIDAVEVNDSAREPEGIRDALLNVGSTLAAALDTRAQLAMLEFQQERTRSERRLIMGAIAAVALAFTLLAAQALLVAVLWEQMGYRSLLVLALLWLLVAAIAGWRMYQASLRSERPFAATAATLRRDREMLFGKRASRSA